MTTFNSKSGDNDFLKTFGFVSNEARKNLVIFFITFLIFSNVFFIYRNIKMQEELNKCNQSKLELTLSLTEKITEEVRKQILPATEAIEKTVIKVDSVANKTNSILLNKK